MKQGWEIRDRHDRETHLNLQRETMGTLESTSNTMSSRRLAISGLSTIDFLVLILPRIVLSVRPIYSYNFFEKLSIAPGPVTWCPRVLFNQKILHDPRACYVWFVF